MGKLNPYNLPMKVVAVAMLMARPAIERMPKLRLLPEQALTVRVADCLRGHTINGRLRAVWLHVANEGKRTQYEGAIIKAMGRIPGAPDFAFMGAWGCGFIELKTDEGRQGEAQEFFEFWTGENSVRYVICRSVAQVEETLKEWGALAK